MTAGQVGTYTISLTDAGAKGIPAEAITVTAPADLTVSTTSVVTDNQGRCTFTATGGSGGSGALTVAGLGLTTNLTVSVNGDALSFTAPAANTNIALDDHEDLHRPLGTKWRAAVVRPADQLCHHARLRQSGGH